MAYHVIFCPFVVFAVNEIYAEIYGMETYCFFRCWGNQRGICKKKKKKTAYLVDWHKGSNKLALTLIPLTPTNAARKLCHPYPMSASLTDLTPSTSRKHARFDIPSPTQRTLKRKANAPRRVRASAASAAAGAAAFRGRNLVHVDRGGSCHATSDALG